MKVMGWKLENHLGLTHFHKQMLPSLDCVKKKKTLTEIVFIKPFMPN